MTTREPPLGTPEEEAALCRAAFKGVKVGAMVWHLHHDQLCEPLTKPPENRIAYILTHKRNKERAARLRLMRPVYAEAVAPAQRVRVEAEVAARKLYDEAEAAAWAVCAEAVAAARKAYHEAVAPAHSAECPNCPWDGKSIFNA
jgi:hypothetical protein